MAIPEHLRAEQVEERYPVYRRLSGDAALPDFDEWSDDPGPHHSFGPPGPPVRRRRIDYWRWTMRGLGGLIILFVLAVGWLAINAPLSKSLRPPTPPSITLLADDGKTPIARRGAVIGAPVDVKQLPKYVPGAFIAIEDRRFYHHWGIDPRGIARAFFHNVRSGGVREGGSTITQQLAKNAFLDSDRTAGRKLREMLVAFWLEAWLTKDQILSRYLSNVYFGDNVYGLTAAARHYFGRAPADLSVGQAAMLAGLVKAPSRLAPTTNLQGAQDRERVVVGAMRATGMLTSVEAGDVRPQRVRHEGGATLPNGTYFADWVLPGARDEAGEIRTETTVRTTLDRRLQAAAERAVRHAGLKRAQVALVAMRPDGRVVAMVGGKDYADSPFNRATQARRQPGSTFKLFVYLAAMRAGMTPDSIVQDEPVTIGDWKPHNSDRHYRGPISLREAFAVSSNVAAARLTQQVGVKAVIRAARDLGISTPIPNEATIALGSSTVSLLELTGAYAAISAGTYPVQARGLADIQQKSWYQSWTSPSHAIDGHVRDEMMQLLAGSVDSGTGREAALSVPTFGKTGTTQDNRDALFMGFAGGLVCGVWVGDDDNKPNPGLSGGGVPARVWRAFMEQALNVAPRVRPATAIPDEAIDPDALPGDDDTDDGRSQNTAGPALGLEGNVKAFGLDLHVGRDGSVGITRSRDEEHRAPARDERRPRESPEAPERED